MHFDLIGVCTLQFKRLWVYLIWRSKDIQYLTSKTEWLWISSITKLCTNSITFYCETTAINLYSTHNRIKRIERNKKSLPQFPYLKTATAFPIPTKNNIPLCTSWKHRKTAPNTIITRKTSIKLEFATSHPYKILFKFFKSTIALPPTSYVTYNISICLVIWFHFTTCMFCIANSTI